MESDITNQIAVTIRCKKNRIAACDSLLKLADELESLPEIENLLKKIRKEDMEAIDELTYELSIILSRDKDG